MNRTFVLTMQLYKRLKTMMNEEKLICALCGERLEPYDEVVSHESKGRITRYYHSECIEKLYVV